MILKLEHIGKSFSKVDVLNDINLECHGGKVYGIIGPNGSGKSVLLKMIAGIMTPSSGTITFNDKILDKKNVYEDNIGICIDKSQMIEELTGLENLLYLASFRKMISEKEIIKWLEEFDLADAMNRKVKNYSMGMKQKMSIIQAVMENQNMVLFDEVSNSLDKTSKEQLYQLILKLKEEGKIIIYVNHNLDEVKMICDEIYEIDNRRLVKC